MMKMYGICCCATRPTKVRNERVQEQKKLLAEELQATVVKLRHDSYRDAAGPTGAASEPTPEEVAEFTDLIG